MPNAMGPTTLFPWGRSAPCAHFLYSSHTGDQSFVTLESVIHTDPLPICFIADRTELYSNCLASLQTICTPLFRDFVDDAEMAASLSSVMLLAPDFLGVETFHRLAGAGPIDHLLVIGTSLGPTWSTNQLDHPFSTQDLLGALKKTLDGRGECRLLDIPAQETHPVDDNELQIGNRVTSKSTPSLGEGVIIQMGPMFITVMFPHAPGKMAKHPIRCHVSVLRRVAEN